jgi:hypothetical protein
VYVETETDQKRKLWWALDRKYWREDMGSVSLLKISPHLEAEINSLLLRTFNT